jgi:hypothetical protein
MIALQLRKSLAGTIEHRDARPFRNESVDDRPAKP